MLGADVETGGVWDPLGFSKDESTLYRSRLIELKHGRVAMLACLGTLVQSFYHLPDEVFSNPRPLAALSQVFAERPVAFWQIFLTLGAIELTIGKQDTANKAPGDIGFGAAFIPDDVRTWLVSAAGSVLSGLGLALQHDLLKTNPQPPRTNFPLSTTPRAYRPLSRRLTTSPPSSSRSSRTAAWPWWPSSASLCRSP